MLQVSNQSSPLTFYKLYAKILARGKLTERKIIMLKIAVCDDDETMLGILTDIIGETYKQNSITFEIRSFLSGEIFLNSYKEHPFDVVFLDIDMPEISGFDIAEQVDNADKTLIVFVTSHDELVYSSIKFRPFRFIRKTYLETELGETLTAVYTELMKRNAARKFMFQTKSSEVLADLNLVEYIEIFGHWILVHIKDNDILECYGSLSDMEHELSNYGFVRTHKSYLVNCRYIYSIEKNQIVLDDKTVIPVSRYKAETVKEKFRSFLRRTI